MMSPWYSLGTVTLICEIGSNSTGPACSIAALKPILPAILKLISDESTEWYLPS